ncbi:MAG TPA: PA0069 family radical SAM protein [Chitinophagales bacterium]|nr:PA0069 family radical SAM protein [Chitinophagales bacterium]
METYIKGRGSQLNPTNRFEKNSHELYIGDLATDEERKELLAENPRTKYIEVFPKTILNKVDSPDIGLAWSMNPYQGCEHGCIYCYARNTHEYWGYSSGMEFEQNILVKKNAPELLEKTLLSRKWEADAIMLSGNTDCYQPAERRLQITRAILATLLKFKHPVGMITKNALVARDLDILKPMAEMGLVGVTMSLTTLDEKLKRIMEPRTSSVNSVLRTIKLLSKSGIPVNVNVAPVIPGINDEGIFDVVKAVAEQGALSASYIVVRLNGHNSVLFEDWVRKNFPDRANKVINQVKTMHGGKLNDSEWGRRMRGEGKFAELIRTQFALARKKHLDGRKFPSLNYSLYKEARDKILDDINSNGQLKLF